MGMTHTKAIILGALASCTANTSGDTSVVCAPLTSERAFAPAGWAGSVITIVMENHSRSQIYGNPDAPYINQLAATNARADGYHDAYVHPSEPNYLWMVAGENFGILDDADPATNHVASTSHLADQIENAGLTWKSYSEGMGAPCGLVTHDRYAARHDPFIFFDDVSGWDGTVFQPSPRCNEHIVDYSQLAIDLENRALPAYVFITPDLDHDMHDGTIAQADQWMAAELPALLGSDAFVNGGVIFLLWDEGGGSPAADDPPFIAISPNAKRGFVSTTDYDTSAFLKTVESALGVAALPCDADGAAVPTMSDLFSVSIAPSPTEQRRGVTIRATM